ncbi:hypothetical protein FGG08_001323 [Glutinoglossum americanum]|uniref:Formin GTPase-binding domain-containing protein n=1 Tax=Glutinoglossum americanum TaxID=1670608 RepID=A0A9P8IDR3_9PEZI|nr:hypothetical protein FGG08_001323 [Glutinoglossum americanum]
MISSTRIDQGQHHRRTKSSVLKSIITPRNHKRNPSAGAAISYSTPNDPKSIYNTTTPLPLLHVDNLSTNTTPLGELFQSRECAPTLSKKQANGPDDRPATSPGRPLHKKTLSSVSLSSLAAKHRAREGKTEDKTRGGDAGGEPKDAGKKLKKSKSQTNFQALLSRPKSSKGCEQAPESRNPKDKENRTPPTSPITAPPPIYAQFASRPVQSGTATNVPLSGVSDVDREMSLYTPQAYTPSKQRNFHGLYERPTLAKRDEIVSRRPKSAYLPSSTSTSSFVETLANIRKSSTNRALPPASPRDASGGEKSGAGQPRRVSWEERVSKHRSSGENSRTAAEKPKEGLTVAKRGSRVMAAVAAFNGRSKDIKKDVQMDPKNIESAFEALLNMRQKLRSLDTHIKADFIKQDKAESATAKSAPSSSARTTLWGATPSTSTTPEQQEQVERGKISSGVMKENSGPSSPGKRARPRSKTFSISRTDVSPIKKQKSDSGTTGRAKSSNFSTSSSTASLHSFGGAQVTTTGPAGKPKPAIPEEFVAYLRKVQKPENVEVGRLHKLRLVLRNERVAWVDSFITMGGMDEIISLLHRIMKVEWREEHEDALLHEVLLCLKALCTTVIALQRLSDIQSSLFPALLNMIFDAEKKGPSEFTTRGIIFSLIFTYLEAAPPHERASRAQIILSYLRDPSPPEDAQPLRFITEMHQPRPYRVWCKEIVNVTKEVFWIFLHGLNVVPIASVPAITENETYMQIHFPRERPPVPAAPYVGGVEWEATNYLANHLDLMNGLIASLPTFKKRNTLREELKVSGFEKMMGISLRTCKEKFYGAVHDGLKTWATAAAADGWDVRDVRMGPPVTEKRERGSPKKKKDIEDLPPKVELPKLELGNAGQKVDAWVY